MNGKHWTDEELLERLYDVGRDDDHLEVCANCGERWNALLLRRQVSKAGIEVKQSLLLRQRLAVMERIETPTPMLVWWRAAAVLAGCCAMVLSVLIYRPQQPKAAVQTASSDAQFFAEIYFEVQQTEPRAVKPIHRLFQGRP